MKNVLVKHRTIYSKSGEAGLTLSKGVVQGIRHFYLGGKVRTVSGDVWDVKKVEHKDYDYITVAPVSG